MTDWLGFKLTQYNSSFQELKSKSDSRSGNVVYVYTAIFIAAGAYYALVVKLTDLQINASWRIVLGIIVAYTLPFCMLLISAYGYMREKALVHDMKAIGNFIVDLESQLKTDGFLINYDFMRGRKSTDITANSLVFVVPIVLSVLFVALELVIMVSLRFHLY